MGGHLLGGMVIPLSAYEIFRPLRGEWAWGLGNPIAMSGGRRDCFFLLLPLQNQIISSGIALFHQRIDMYLSYELVPHDYLMM